jgi:hypothetical protein
MAKKMPSFGSQGTAAPVNTAQPIKAGMATDTDKSTPGPSVTQAGVQVPGIGNNDKRKVK